MASRGAGLHRSWPKPATIGFLGATSPSVWGEFVTAFENQLRALGWIEGSNVNIKYEWAGGDAKKYAQIAKKFVADDVDIIVTSGTEPTLTAANATSTIPIVFASAGDPKQTGIKQSNITGRSNRQAPNAVQRLAALRRLVPGMKRLAYIGNPKVKNTVLEIAQIGNNHPGIQLIPCDVTSASQIVSKIKALRGQADALYVCTDPFVTTNAVTINIAAANAGLPTMHAFREYVESGGLASLGPSFRDMFADAARLVHQVLRGSATPAELPIREETKTELYINGNTAKTLGIKIPKGMKATII